MAKTAAPLLRSIALNGFLSFGIDAGEIALTPLNVIIGPNGSGKSNLVEAFSILRAVPSDLPLPIRQGGGVHDWLFRGDRTGQGGGSAGGAGWGDGTGAGVPSAKIEVIFESGTVTRGSRGEPAVRYRLIFGAEGDAFVVVDERIENSEPVARESKPYFYFGYEKGRPMINVSAGKRTLQREDIDPTQSILSQRRDPETYPELTRVGDLLRNIRVYRRWPFGPEAVTRNACRADVRTDHLAENLENLPARMAALKGNPVTKRRLLELVRELAPGFDDLEIVPEHGALNLYLTEGTVSIPARRLSDGTLRYLCLLAILVDPSPPPLIVIEEPELGLHPDVLPTLRDLLLEASSRCQLIVTTHSTQLIDALTDYPESVMICEKETDRTVITRLNQADIDAWRDHGSLGQLWMAGHLGGTRW